MSHVVIINGSGGVGKDTFCALCAKFCDVSVCSSVSEVKRAAMLLGWDGQKDARSRKFLSDLKDLATAYSDAPMQHMREYVASHNQPGEIVFLMIREPHEIERAKQEFGAKTVLIKRPQAAAISTNHADRDVNQYSYDYTIYNVGTIEDLECLAVSFVNHIFGCQTINIPIYE